MLLGRVGAVHSHAGGEVPGRTHRGRADRAEGHPTELNIYAISAPLLGEAAQRLLDGDYTQPGAHAPAEVFDANAILAALARGHTSFEVTSEP